MAEKYPLKGIFDGGGVATDLGEFAVGDFVGLSSGGLGFTSIAGGDLMVGAVGGGSINKLPIGAPSTVLMISSGVPAWQLITNANIAAGAAIDWTKMNGSLPTSKVPVPLTLTYDPVSSSAAHLELVRTNATLSSEWIAFRTGAVAYDMYFGREASTDKLSIARWNGAGAPVPFISFNPANQSLTTEGNYLARGGIRVESVYNGLLMGGAGPGIELSGNVSGSAYIQSYDRTAAAPGSLAFDAADFRFTIGSTNRAVINSTNVLVRHGSAAGAGIYYLDGAGLTIGYASGDNGWTFATNTAGFAYDFKQNSTTGFGMRMWSVNNSQPAFSVLNAAGSAYALQVLPDGSMVVGGAIDAPNVRGRQSALPLHGYVSLNRGDASNVGYIEWWKPGPTRIGYMGYGAGTYLTLNLESSHFFITGGNVEINNNQVLAFRDSGGTAKAGLMISSGNVMTLGEPTIPLRHAALSMSFYNKIGTVALQTITGSRGGNAALATLLTALHNLNLINDTSTA